MKILFITNIPAPYDVAFLNELGRLISVDAIFERGSSSERDSSWKNFSFDNFKGKILRGIPVGSEKAISPQVIFKLKKVKYDHIIVANPLTPTGMISIIYLRLRRIKYILMSEGGKAKSGFGLKERVKKYFLRDAYLYLSGASLGDIYFEKYGASKNRIFSYPFTSLYKKDILSVPIDSKEKRRYKSEIGLTDKFTIISVGQFINRKGFDVLIKATADIDNINVLIIGGVPTKEYLDLIKETKNANIIFKNFMPMSKLIEFYRASDLFVLPTREDTYGLVINEAMAQGLPIITTYECVAGVELIEEGKNGYLVQNENTVELNSKIRLLMDNHNLNVEMSKNNLTKIKGYTYEEMASRIYQLLLANK